MKYAALFLLTAVFSIGSCSHRIPTATVELIDTSLSISPRAEASALNAVRKQIDQMGRGDRLILIPVTGDAKNDAGGRVLRLEAPTVRETYDTDLRRFQTEAKNQFSAWAAMHGAEAARTDLLGSMDVARQELTSLADGTARRLILVSDLIEDDGDLHFAYDPRLADPPHARELAINLRGEDKPSWRSVAVCLGRLESTDFGALPNERRQAIDVFWKEFFGGGGTSPDVQIDGIGLLENLNDECPAKVASTVAGGAQ